MTDHTNHIHHHVNKHEKAHKRLKKVVKGHHPKKASPERAEREKVFPLFMVTFVLVLLTLLLFRNWGNIVSIFNSEDQKTQEQVYTHGVKTGVLTVYKVDKQAGIDDRHLLTSIPTSGSATGVTANNIVGEGRGVALPEYDQQLKNTVWLTNYLSRGQHLTKLQQSQAKALQKSILSTYYLGEKTVDINSTLQTDSQILSQIRNTLSIDLFQYLDQAVNRSDKLDEYQFLLNSLLSKTDQRINDLQYKIDFLNSNSANTATEITTSETAFFDNLNIFEGEEAEKKLGEFIGLQESQVEIRAKLGAYTSLQGYYKFFKPRLENLTTAIRANRAALIAGVKVVEIQNMSLPLIIREK